MTSRATPPLTWLRAFEATGRLLSFKGAAEELNVSPSTISHQIRELERHLGTPLFSRHAKAIALTDEGQHYLPSLTAAFAQIGATFDVERAHQSELRIGSMPYLTNEVLLPNVDQLKQVLGYPHLSFRSETSVDSLLHVSPKERLDAVIRYDTGRSAAGLLSLDLFDIELVPVQAIGKAKITDLAVLLEQPIIRIHGPFDAWREWAKQQHSDTNPEQRPQNVVLETDNYHAATLAAKRGDGMCLGVLPFMQPWLRSGQIQALDNFRCTIPHKACLVYAAHNGDNPAIQRLGEWLISFLS